MKWVSGKSVESWRIVPSLNVNTPFLALKIPFSKGSGSLSSEIKPITPLTSSTLRTPTLLEAFESICAKLISFWPDLPITVGDPQCGQIAWNELNLQSGFVHSLLANSTLIFFFLAASATKRLFPPLFPIGNSTWGAGLINLSFDFSGRPTLVPI